MKEPTPEAARWRAHTARALYSLAALGLAVGAIAALFGGGQLSLFGLPVSLTSWKILRPIAAVLVLALACDSRRWERLEAVRAWVERLPRWGWGLALAGVALYLALFKLTQHQALRTGAYDLSMFQYALHFTLEGDFLWAFGIGRNFFSEHFSPVLLLLVPLYAIAPSPETLLVVQSLAVAAAAVPLYRLSLLRGLTPLVSGMVALAYLGNAYLWRAFSFDFHVELFAPLAIFCTALFAHTRRWWAFHLALLFTLSIKEEMAFVTLCLAGLLILTDRPSWRHALAAAGVSALWAVAAFKWIIPASYPHAQSESHFIERYAHLGSTYSELLWSLLTRPEVTLRAVTGAPMRELLGSLGFLPLLDPWSLLASLPPLLIHLVSGYEYQASLKVYYALPGATLLFLGLPRALRRLEAWWGPRAAWAGALLALAAHPGARWLFPVEPRDGVVRQRLARFSPEEPLAAQSPLVPHLPPSKQLHLFPRREGARFILLAPQRDPWPLSPQDYRKQVEALLSGEEYGVVEHHDGLLILERGHERGGNSRALESLSLLPQ